MVGQRGLVDGAGVVIQPARDGEIQAVRALGHAQRLDQLEHFAQLGNALAQRRTGADRRFQRLQLRQRIGMPFRAHRHESENPGHLLGSDAEAFAHQCVAHIVGTALVDLVDLAQYSKLQLALSHAQAFEEAAQQLAVVQLHLEVADAQLGEHRMDHRQDFGVVTDAQRILADHVDIALVELTEAPALRTLAAVHALHLITTEWKAQVVLVLGDIARQRHGQVEAQCKLGQPTVLGTLVGGRCGIGQRAGGLYEIHLALGLAAGLGQQHIGQLEHRGFRSEGTRTARSCGE